MTAVATQPAVWQELQRCFDDQDYDKMLLLCDKILLQSPGDLLTIECRLQALTALSKYNAVIRAFSDKQKHPIPADIDRKFLAYAFYKVNKLSEALQVIEALPGGHREQPPVKHLEAQIAYKAEKYNESLALYQQLLNSTEKSSPFYNEVLANYYACHAALAMAEKKPFEELENSRKIPSFEAAYNIAVGLAALGRNDRATERLKMATNACKASLKQAGYTENEINEELACIEVQTAYILQKQSITGEARKIYEKVLNSNRGDFTSKIVALNNYLSLPGRREKLRQACRFKWGKVVGDAISSPFKIPGYLKQQLRVNQFLFSSVFGRKKFVWPRFESLAKDYPKDERLFLAELYHSFAGNTSSEIPSLIKRIQDFIGGSFSTNPIASLHLSQLYLKQEQKKEAVEILRQAKASTACKCMLIHLLASIGDLEAASNEAADLISQATDARSLQKLAIFLSRSVSAGSHATELLVKSGSPADLLTIACQSYAALSMDGSLAVAAQHHAQLVKSLPELQKRPPIKFEFPDLAMKNQQKKQRKRRHRKKPIPKKYDPNVTPDPERWLPKHLRSTYLKQKKRGKKHSEVARGPQGAVPTILEKPAAASHANQPSNNKAQKKKKGGKKR